MPEFGNKKSWEDLIKAHKLGNSAEVIEGEVGQSPLAQLAYAQQERNSFGLDEDTVAKDFDPLETLIDKRKRFPEIDIEGNIFHILKQDLHMEEDNKTGTLTIVVDAEAVSEEAYYLYEIALEKYKKIFKKKGISPVLDSMRQEPAEKSGQYKLIFEFGTTELN